MGIMSGIFPVMIGKTRVAFGRVDSDLAEFVTGKGKLAICVIRGS
eukprot:XP_001708431.1 Hypothetical protein GL50803_115752 [Giardia lamblia ATCC 50803]